jgi:plastocyanin
MTAPLRLIAITCVLIIGAACSGASDPAPAPAAPAGKRVDPATTGTVAGIVRFTGTMPERELIRMTQDRNCVEAAGPNPQSEAVLADGDGVRNVFVHIKDGLDPAFTFDAPSAPVVLDQKGCIYRPRVLGICVGQALEVVNTDPTFHNVHALPMINQEFNTGQRQNDRYSTVFTTPEVMVRFKCDAHGWMAAWVGVTTHPYFSVSGDGGRFDIPQLPAGTYTLEAWHERLGTQTATVTIAQGQTATADFTFAMPGK